MAHVERCFGWVSVFVYVVADWLMHVALPGLQARVGVDVVAAI